MYNIIDKKKKGQVLTQDEVKWVIDGLMDESVKDYQMTALLMAIFINGMTDEETAFLTDAMLYSGTTLKFEGENIVDKHSTGGIGDKASFILAPIAAACGVKVPMIAGRGLGFTGGTVDKVEAIPGFKTDLDLKGFEELLSKKGMVLIGQTEDIAPADKKIYALRDVTATIDSIPLITASIMSKKLAEGANAIVMDIKVGSGAFMRNKTQAKKLARSILNTAKRFDKKAVTLLTNMNQPLGQAVGHSLEIIESIEVLKGNGAKDITDLSIALAAHMIHIGGVEPTYNKALKKAKLAVKDGSALKKFEELLANQGGDTKVIKNYDTLDLSKVKTDVLAPKSGYIKSFVNDQIGFLCTELGGGRKIKSDKIDFGVGFYFHKRLGDKIKAGEPILTIYHRKEQVAKVMQIHQDFLNKVIKISGTKVVKPEIIYEILSN
ncbi:MAG: pyrimidine-nucleoside phosphorylase [Bacteriovoracaceae bacterium]|jgi:pyrimidine-nucleoside phosphorylase